MNEYDQGQPAQPTPINNNRARRTVSVLLTRQDLAAELGISIKTIDAWRRTGNGPRATMIGRLVRYDLEDVAAWLASRKSTSTSDRKGC